MGEREEGMRVREGRERKEVEKNNKNFEIDLNTQKYHL
jgi:hypothetical protein